MYRYVTLPYLSTLGHLPPTGSVDPELRRTTMELSRQVSLSFLLDRRSDTPPPPSSMNIVVYIAPSGSPQGGLSKYLSRTLSFYLEPFEPRGF